MLKGKKEHLSFMLLHTRQGSLFPQHGLDLPASSNLGETTFTRYSRKYLLFLKPIVGISENTF